MKFKVGDKVRIKGDGIFDSTRYHVGDTAVITGIEHGICMLSMKNGGKQEVGVYYADEYIEKVEECAMKFKVGDRVSINGLTGEISDIDTEVSTYHVGDCWYSENALTAAPSKLAGFLGVDDDTPFNIVDSDGDDYAYSPYVVHDGKLIDCESDTCDVPAELLNGEAKIVPIDGEWYEGKPLYYVDACGEVSETDYDRCDDLCIALVLLGNAFTTEEGAKSAAERINADIIEKLGEC